MVLVSQMWKKWIPAAVVPVVIAGVVIAVPLAANASGNLPEKTPQEVLALVAASNVTAMSGTFEQTSNLGLPQLPTGTSAQGSGSTAQAASALELLTGNHTARVYVDGSNGSANMRLQVLDSMAERDVIRSGSDVWLYDSKKQAATHMTLPEKTDATGSVPDAAAATQTPDQLAAKLLAAVTPTTAVSVGNNVSVAGRSAYDLVLTPEAGDTLVGSVSIAVDGVTGLPLSVEIVPKGSADPAFTTQFTSISFDAPSADLFTFTPPSGTTVTEQALPAETAKPTGQRGTAGDKPVVTGAGWSSIVELNVGTDQSALTSSPLFAQLMTPVDGGNVFSTSLVNVLLTTDGRVFAGSVTAEALQAAAAAAN
jgi:outer membrane lipoprotein-sorting protein